VSDDHVGEAFDALNAAACSSYVGKETLGLAATLAYDLAVQVRRPMI
jgi:hypothetical protein